MRPVPRARGPAPSSGVIHVNFRHIAGFTVIGNHLAQHRGLSLVAIGLAVHIQSLPAGAKIGIKVLAARFPDSETRIAAGLRELEATGYLHRTRVRLPNGRIVTRTTSHNQPGADASTATEAPQPQTRRSKPAAPQTGDPELHRLATALLADLRRHAPQLVLSERDVHSLAPAVATWLERRATPDTIRRNLTADLPIPLKHPAKLLRHRLTTLLPPPLPGAEDLAPVSRSVIVIPLQNCDGCDRAFRSRHPGHCRDCHTGLQAAA